MSDTPKTLNIAVIGGGMFFDDIIGQTLKDFMRGGIAPALSSIGMSHLAPAVADVKVNVVAVGTHNPTSGTAGRIAESFARDFPDRPVEPCYGQTVWRDVLARHKPDVLFVATPDHLHVEPILAALDAGCDVVTEKPLSLTTADADRIIAAACKAQLIVAVDMHKRYDPFVRDMMTNARQKYGQINRVRAVLEEPLTVSTEVFAWVEKSNPFAYVGCHWLDVVHHYLNVKPVSVFATGQRNLLSHWDEHHKQIAQRQGVCPTACKRRDPIDAWDSLDVAVTYDDGMRGDYNNNWINPAEFEGAVNQEIELYGIYGRGIVDQQDRGYRETVTGEGSRTRNPAFGAHIQHEGGHVELFGYGKASIAAGLLAIIRRRFLAETCDNLAATYPNAASQRTVTQVIEAAGIVAQRNYDHHQAGCGTPATALLHNDGIEIIDPSCSA